MFSALSFVTVLLSAGSTCSPEVPKSHFPLLLPNFLPPFEISPVKVSFNRLPSQVSFLLNCCFLCGPILVLQAGRAGSELVKDAYDQIFH